jgi:hypothetical protein
VPALEANLLHAQASHVDPSAADRARLEAIVANWNSPQKHVWRARIVLMTADSLGTGRDHAPQRQEQDLRVALAGAVHGRRGRRAVARQDPALAHPASGIASRRARRRADPERAAWRGYPLDWGGDGRGRRDQRLLGAASDFGFSIGYAWNHLDQAGPPHNPNGFQNLEITPRYQFLLNAPHEAVASVGVITEIGGTGARGSGQYPFRPKPPPYISGREPAICRNR